MDDNLNTDIAALRKKFLSLEFVPFNEPSPGVVCDIWNLVSTCTEHDGFEPRVELNNSLNHTKTRPWLWIARIEGVLIGCATVFTPMAHEIEISICIDPAWRRKRVGTILFLCAHRSWQHEALRSVLVPCNAKSIPARAFAKALGASVVDHAELSMHLDLEQIRSWTPLEANSLTVRQAQPTDIDAMAEVCARAYNDSLEGARDFIVRSMHGSGREGWVGLAYGGVVALCFLGDSELGMTLNTVAVDPACQGRGYAYYLLSTVLRSFALSEMHDQELIGLEVLLEVDSSKTRAKSLYQRLGFTPVSETVYLKKA